MKIGCLVVTERRWPILPIAAASFATQTYADRVLLVLDSTPEPDVQALSELALLADPLVYNRSALTGPDTVPTRIDEGCGYLFYKLGCDAVAIWDDDDWAPPERLRLSAEALGAGAQVCSYDRGYFVNLRSFRGHSVVPAWGSWGGGLCFTREAWEDAGGFEERPMPGYDRSFVAPFLRAEVVPDGHSVSTHRRRFRTLPTTQPPVAFSHGKNVATFLVERGEDMSGWLQRELPAAVLEAVLKARQYLIERRVFPLQP